MSKQTTYPINLKDINADIEFYNEVVEKHTEAEKYLLSFYWCKKIKESFLCANLGRVFCIFVFEIENSASLEDDFLWVIVGDIPSMYLDFFGENTTAAVTRNYIELAQDWIDHIRKGQSVNECYPFNAEPTIELAELLDKKISFMRDTLVHHMEDITFKKEVN